MTSIFLFAHQDDEFGIFQNIIEDQRKGRQIVCAYLTDGGASSIRRNQESLAVLKKMGFQEQDIFFAGHALAIPDAGLPECLERAADWMHEWLAGFPQVKSIYVPAWEGGHHDHDALHAITVSVAHKIGVLTRVRQFPLYNGYRCAEPLFRVFLPLPLNGEVEKTRISWKSRFQFLRYCLSYPSQAMTWLGLFPFVTLHYLSSGMQMLQPVSYERICQRPHDGALYYERRGFYTWEKMAARLSHWRNAESRRPRIAN